MEKTVVLVKPHAIREGLMGQVLARLAQLNLYRITVKSLTVTPEMAAAHLDDLRVRYAGTDVFARNYSSYVNQPIVAILLAGDNAVARVRELVGATDPSKADRGTIRAELSNDTLEFATLSKRGINNVVHASDSVESATREIGIWLPQFADARVAALAA